MNPLRRLRLWRKAMTQKEELDLSMNEEMRSHIELHILDNIASGMSQEAARAAAFRQFGRIEAIKEECRDQRGVNWIENLSRDLRSAWRALPKRPGFSLAAVTMLALGIGANTLVFGIVQALLFRSTGFDGADRLVWIETVSQTATSGGGRLSWRDRADVLESASAFQSIALIGSPGATWDHGDQFEELPALSVTPNLADILRIHPVLGRTLADFDIQPQSQPVVMISYELWQSRFGGRSNIIGNRVQLNESDRIIVGVLPARLEFPLGQAPTAGSGSRIQAGVQAFWFPLNPQGEDRLLRNTRMFAAIARLAPKATPGRANTELGVVGQRLAAEFPETNRGLGFRSIDFREKALGHLNKGTTVLGAAVVAVLLICCVNLAILQSAAGTTRRRDAALRLALGATRIRIVQALVIENLLLALLGGTLGLSLAGCAIEVIRRFSPDELALLRQTEINPAALTFTASLSILTTLLFGLIPAVSLSGVNAAFCLGTGNRTSAGRGNMTWLSALLVGQIAAVLSLLAATSLLIGSFRRIAAVDLGFQPGPVIAIDLVPGKFSSNEAGVRFYRELVGRLAALPGITAAGTIQSIPFTGKWTFDEHAQVFGGSLPKAEQPSLAGTFVAFDYFKAMGISLLSGRVFSDNDLHEGGDQTAVILNETAANLMFSGLSAVGHRVSLEHQPENFLEVVGVVKDTRDVRIDTYPTPRFYLPYAFGGAQIVLRTSENPQTMVGLVRSAIKASNPKILILDIKPLSEIVSSTLAERRFLMSLLAGYALIAFVSAIWGIFSVVACQVAQRRHEFGIRLALGACPTGIVRLVLGRAGKLALLGLGIGFLLYLPASRLLANQLFELSPTDGYHLGAVCILLLASSIVAAAVPALRVGRINPAEILRAE